jgi:hypothetical protein
MPAADHQQPEQRRDYKRTAAEYDSCHVGNDQRAQGGSQPNSRDAGENRRLECARRGLPNRQGITYLVGSEPGLAGWQPGWQPAAAIRHREQERVRVELVGRRAQSCSRQKLALPTSVRSGMSAGSYLQTLRPMSSSASSVPVSRTPGLALDVLIAALAPSALLGDAGADGSERRSGKYEATVPARAGESRRSGGRRVPVARVATSSHPGGGRWSLAQFLPTLDKVPNDEDLGCRSDPSALVGGDDFILRSWGATYK